MAPLQEAVAVVGRPAHHPHRSRVRVAVVSLAAAVALALSVFLATGPGMRALNPQPIPPGVHGDAVLALNPQPLPPGDAQTLA
jgi:hypothetical protein